MSERENKININGDESEISPGLLDKVNNLPKTPGIYQYKNKNGTIIYIGKAKNLRNRVKSYFQRGRPADAKTKAMISKIADVETIKVDSEAEALILEDTLVKKHKPKYNVLLRDDKSFPFVRVTKEDYPRVFPTRTVVRDGSKYYGPFTDVKNLRRLLKVLRSMYYLRSCDYNITDKSIEEGKYRVCLDYHIEKCKGPCEGLISKEKYNENVKSAVQIINGKTREAEKKLLDEMENLAEELRFEEAAQIRDRYAQLKEYLSRQKIVTAELVDRDVFGYAKIEGVACALVFKVREGKLVGRRHFLAPNSDDQSDERILRSCVETNYLEAESAPEEIRLPFEIEETHFLLDLLKDKSSGKVKISVPKIGEMKQLVNMASTNAEYQAREYLLAIAKREQSVPRSVSALERDLRLPRPPARIECFDNSHIQGAELVSSMIVFVDGKPKKSDYRKFKIREVHKNDDFAAMRETVRRRYSRVINEEAELPDLIIVDGGKGQLSGAAQVLRDLKIFDKVSIIGLAKRIDEVFVPGEKDSILLPKTSSGLKLIQQARDEAHRFAITFHRKLRDKRTLKTELTDISGIGEKTSQKLLIEFGSVEGVKNADYDKLKAAVGEKLAKTIANYFYAKKSGE